VVILGASFDSVGDNLAFAQAQGFDYRLLSDTDRTTGEAYGVLRDRTEPYAAYPDRIAYLIDPEGTIAASYEVSDVAGFADAVLADLRSIKGAQT
jgi:peroxiredoxin Q/BCP